MATKKQDKCKGCNRSQAKGFNINGTGYCIRCHQLNKRGLPVPNGKKPTKPRQRITKPEHISTIPEAA